MLVIFYFNGTIYSRPGKLSKPTRVGTMIIVNDLLIIFKANRAISDQIVNMSKRVEH